MVHPPLQQVPVQPPTRRTCSRNLSLGVAPLDDLLGFLAK
jgi:hypothetical protein